ncbi:patatin-like phospholipase family protein [Chitinimonas sp.]|uniref:patatin-like phospholipase family protein n=1 Tax=Chitinimonas sp. TaxID=1934313 RepID=UPI002F932784
MAGLQGVNQIVARHGRHALLLTALCLGGCATSVFNPVSNVPLKGDVSPDMGSHTDIVGPDVIALSFSGGGLRAAAFAHGALRALQETRTADGDLLDDITLLSSVSGGSLVSAYWGVYGRDGLADFRQEVLLRDYERDMRLSILNPRNFMRLLGGGLNDRSNFSAVLDDKVFKGATFSDIYQHSRADVRINATDLYHRISFPFIPRVFSLLCSDIRPYKVADAVAASMAVPLVFAPVVLQSYSDHCIEPPPAWIEQTRNDPHAPRLFAAAANGIASYRDPNRTRYIKLVDGGITDNLGLSTLLITRALLGTPHAPLTERDAVRIRQMLFVVVDSGLGPRGDWTWQPNGPDGVDYALSSTDAAIDASSRFAADSFARMVQDMQRDTIAFRCQLPATEVLRLRGTLDGWRCDDVKFEVELLSFASFDPATRKRLDAIPTRLTLTEEQVDTAIKAGEEGMRHLPSLQRYLARRAQSIATAPH